MPRTGRDAGSGDPAYRASAASAKNGGPTSDAGASDSGNAGSGDPAYRRFSLPSRGVAGEPPPRRLRRLHRVWPDREGNISYLLTSCVEGRARVLNNELIFERLVSFLLSSPKRYHWFGRRFVIMPDHIHVIAHQGHDAVRLGQWIKALKAIVGGAEHRELHPAGTPGLQNAAPWDAKCVVSGDERSAGSGDPAYRASATSAKNAGSGDPAYNTGGGEHEFTRIKRTWRWQPGFHDHKFRTRESEARKWEYVCLNPVREGLVKRPEEWPFGGEIFYDEAGGARLVRGTPPLLETGVLIEEDGARTQRGEAAP